MHTAHDETATSPRASQVGLSHADAGIRQQTIAELIERPDETALHDLDLCLNHEDDNVRHLAVIALGALGSPAVDSLAKALHETFSKITRVAAASGLGRIGADSRPAIPHLRQCMLEAQEPLLWHAGWALSRIGSEAVPALTSLLPKETTAVRLMALQALTWIGPDAQSSLPEIDQCGEESPDEIWAQCIAARVKISEEPDDGVDQLVQATKDESRRDLALQKLGELGEDGQRGLPTVRDHLTHSDPATRCVAMMAYARIRDDEAEAIERLRPHLHDEVTDVCLHAIMAIGSYGPAAMELIPQLRELYGHPDPRVAPAAQAAVRMIQS